MTAGPDDPCSICDVTRENHGDALHEFNMEGVLKKKAPPEPPRQQPPRHRDDPAMPMMPSGNISVAAAISMEHNLTLRLLEKLMAKGVIDGKDLIYVLGGNDATE